MANLNPGGRDLQYNMSLLAIVRPNLSRSSWNMAGSMHMKFLKAEGSSASSSIINHSYQVYNCLLCNQGRVQSNFLLLLGCVWTATTSLIYLSMSSMLLASCNLTRGSILMKSWKQTDAHPYKTSWFYNYFVRPYDILDVIVDNWEIP